MVLDGIGLDFEFRILFIVLNFLHFFFFEHFFI